MLLGCSAIKAGLMSSRWAQAVLIRFKLATHNIMSSKHDQWNFLVEQSMDTPGGLPTEPAVTHQGLRKTQVWSVLTPSLFGVLHKMCLFQYQNLETIRRVELQIQMAPQEKTLMQGARLLFRWCPWFLVLQPSIRHHNPFIAACDRPRNLKPLSPSEGLHQEVQRLLSHHQPLTNQNQPHQLSSPTGLWPIWTSYFSCLSAGSPSWSMVGGDCHYY